MSSEVSTAWEDEYLFCQFEDAEGLRFLHVDVKKFSPQAVRHMKEVFPKIKEKCKEDGFNRLYSYTQNLKFGKLISKDSEHLTSFNFDNEQYEVLRWVLR